MEHRILFKVINLNWIVTVILSVTLTSCKSFEPQYAEDEKLMCWAYEKAYLYDIDNPIVNSGFEREFYDAFLGLASLYGAKKSCSVDVETRLNNTSLVDWQYNEDTMKSKFDVYTVIYKVELKDRTLYVIVNLIENTKDGRYEGSLIDVETSLASALDAFN